MSYQEILPVASPCIVHYGGILFRQMLIMNLICVVVQVFLIYMPTHKVAELLSKVPIPNLTISMQIYLQCDHMTRYRLPYSRDHKMSINTIVLLSASLQLNYYVRQRNTYVRTVCTFEQLLIIYILTSYKLRVSSPEDLLKTEKWYGMLSSKSEADDFLLSTLVETVTFFNFFISNLWHLMVKTKGILMVTLVHVVNFTFKLCSQTSFQRIYLMMMNLSQYLETHSAHQLLLHKSLHPEPFWTNFLACAKACLGPRVRNLPQVEDNTDKSDEHEHRIELTGSAKMKSLQVVIVVVGISHLVTFLVTHLLSLATRNMLSFVFSNVQLMLDSLLIYDHHAYLVGPHYQAEFSLRLPHKTFFMTFVMVFQMFLHPTYLQSQQIPESCLMSPTHTDPGQVAG